MNARTRPDLEVRLIGPAVTVQSFQTLVSYCLRAVLGHQIYRHIRTHPGRHPGEIRSYIVVVRRQRRP